MVGRCCPWVRSMEGRGQLWGADEVLAFRHDMTGYSGLYVWLTFVSYRSQGRSKINAWDMHLSLLHPKLLFVADSDLVKSQVKRWPSAVVSGCLTQQTATEVTTDLLVWLWTLQRTNLFSLVYSDIKRIITSAASADSTFLLCKVRCHFLRQWVQ